MSKNFPAFKKMAQNLLSVPMPLKWGPLPRGTTFFPVRDASVFTLQTRLFPWKYIYFPKGRFMAKIVCQRELQNSQYV